MPHWRASAADRAAFEERGFFKTPVVFESEAIASAREACRAIYAAYAECLPLHDPSGREVQRRRPFLPRMVERSGAIEAFARHPVLIQLARDFIGDDADLGWSQACTKLPDPDDATTFPFHQDGYFAEVSDADHGYACFIALSPLSDANGTLHFAAGAHKTRLPHVRNERHAWWECSVEGLEVVEGALEPGQMIVYRNMTPHGSAPNRTEAPREALLLSYGLPGTRNLATGEPHGDQHPVLRRGVVVAAARR